MNWKFWQKLNHREKHLGTNEIMLTKPKEIPERVGMYLVTRLKLDPDWVWSLECALRPKPDEKKDFDIRVFNPASAANKGIKILNYNSLDLHPNMILFSGSFNRKTGRVIIEEPLEKVA